MRCTNRLNRLTAYCVLCILICVSLSGCGKSKIPLDYKVTNDISVTGLESRADGFSSNIAVTDKDVSAKNGFVLEEDAAGAENGEIERGIVGNLLAAAHPIGQ